MINLPSIVTRKLVPVEPTGGMYVIFTHVDREHMESEYILTRRPLGGASPCQGLCLLLTPSEQRHPRGRSPFETHYYYYCKTTRRTHVIMRALA